MPSSTRRQFLKTGAYTAGAAAGAPLLSRPLLAMLGPKPELVPPIVDARIKALVQTGLDAARAAGAAYADVRLTCSRFKGGHDGYMAVSAEEGRLDAGVRVLISGYWGFASGPVWSTDELSRLGREAARQAKVNALGKSREVILPPVPVIRDGHWETPIKRDPWTVPIDEMRHTIEGLNEACKAATRRQHRYGVGVLKLQTFAAIRLRETAFGSTEGSYYTQRQHWAWGKIEMMEEGLVGPAAAGWEHFTDQPLVESFLQYREAEKERSKFPVVTFDVGRYDVVLDPKIMAALISKTIGAATELDRVMGFEANATGTSYITDPDEMLGTLKIGSPLLTVTANRSEPGGVATVKWDAEGVEPDTVTLIKNGVLTDFQTHRDSVGWIKELGAQRGLPFRSHGYADVEHAGHAPMVRSGNLVMTPASEAVDIQELEAGIKDGWSVEKGSAVSDFQCRTGFCRGRTYKIKNGKRVGRVPGPESPSISFDTIELWKKLGALGGAGSAQRFAYGFDAWVPLTKGMPAQSSYHSVTAVPALLKDVALISPSRR